MSTSSYLTIFPLLDVENDRVTPVTELRSLVEVYLAPQSMQDDAAISWKCIEQSFICSLTVRHRSCGTHKVI